MRVEERKRALLHGAALASAELHKVEHAGLGGLEGAVEVLAGVDVAAVLPLHLHKRANRHGVGLAKVGAGTQDVEELVLLAELGEAGAQLGVDLLAGGGQQRVHLLEALVHVGERLVALLLVEQLGGDQSADALRHLGLRHALAPGVDPGGPLAVIDLGALAVGHGDDLGAGGQRHLAAVDDLLRVAAVAAGDDERLLAEALGSHQAKLARGVDRRGKRGGLALEQLVGRHQVDHRTAAGDPKDVLDLTFTLDDFLNQIMCVHADVPPRVATLDDNSSYLLSFYVVLYIPRKISHVKSFRQICSMLFYLWTLDVEDVARAHDLLAAEQQGPLIGIGKVGLHIEERLTDRYLQQWGRLNIGQCDLNGTGVGLERRAA